MKNGYRQIDEYPYYFINKRGEVFSLYRDKKIKPIRINNGALKVLLRKDNKTHGLSLAVLVWKAFKNIPLNGTQIKYYDNNPENLFPYNLYQPLNYDSVVEIDIDTIADAYQYVTTYTPNQLRKKLNTYVLKKILESLIIELRWDVERLTTKRKIFYDYTKYRSITPLLSKYNTGIYTIYRLINESRKELIDEIYKDVERGILTKPTDYNTISKKQKRKKISTDELLKKWQKHCANLFNLNN